MKPLKKIVLTRPLTQAQPLAEKLRTSGYSVVLFPLLEIAPLPDQSELQCILRTALSNLSRYAIAIFVSPNAIHAVFQHNQVSPWPPEVAIAVMGEGSRLALAQYGINQSNTTIYCPPDSLHSDSEALLNELDLPRLKRREAVIFRAETGREFFAQALIAHHINVTKVVAYRRLVPAITPQTSQLLLELLASVDEQTDWVISSSEALGTLVAMTEKIADGAVARLRQINLLAPHQRIAATAEQYGFKHVRLIGSGDENLLLALQSRP